MSALAGWLHTIAASPLADEHRTGATQDREHEIEVEVEVEVVRNTVASRAGRTDEDDDPSPLPPVESTISVAPLSASCNASEPEPPSTLERAASSIESKPVVPSEAKARAESDWDTALGGDAEEFSADSPTALAACMRSLAEGWGNPASSLADKPEGAAPPAIPKRITPKLHDELRRILPRLHHHIKAHDWAIECAATTFKATKPEYDRLCAVGKHEQIFFWELQETFRKDNQECWTALRDRYSAVIAAIDLYLEAPPVHFRTPATLRLVACAVGILAKALKKLDNTGLRDVDAESLVRLCEKPLSEGTSLFALATREGKFNLEAFNERIESIRKGAHEEIAKEAAPKNALNKLSYHLGRVKKSPSDAESHSTAICKAVANFVHAGKSLTDPELRARFDCLDSIEMLPQAVREDPRCAELIEILQNPQVSQIKYRKLAEVEEEEEDDETEDSTARAPTPEVLAVREVLRGKRMVIIGGDERPDSTHRIQEAFQLRELHWIETQPNGAHSAFSPPIRDPDTAIVVLLIRWSRHQFGDVVEICKQFGKPFVRATTGYNPNTIALAIVKQASDKLDIKPPVGTN